MHKIDILTQHKKIFVIGFIGSEFKEVALHLADRLEYDFVDIDSEIVKRDGRSIKRICMMMGEHEYRNKEYEILEELDKKTPASDCKGMVVACSDGIVLDDMNMEILKRNCTLFLRENIEKLYENAMLHKNDVPYAFISDENQIFVKNHFRFLYESRDKLYNQFTAFEKTEI